MNDTVDKNINDIQSKFILIFMFRLSSKRKGISIVINVDFVNKIRVSIMKKIDEENIRVNIKLILDL